MIVVEPTPAAPPAAAKPSPTPATAKPAPTPVTPDPALTPASAKPGARASEPTPVPHLVVFGRDAKGKPHASWFDQASAALATKAAGIMKMHALPIESDALRALAASLPRGRVFSSGRAFTPFVNAKLYGELIELTRDVVAPSAAEQAAGAKAAAVEAAIAKAEQAVPRAALQLVAGRVDAQGDGPAANAAAPPAPVTNIAKLILRPTKAEDVGIGSVVLATTGPTEGWWEAEVIGTNGTMLTLRWRDYAEPTVVRRRTEVGFLPAPQG